MPRWFRRSLPTTELRRPPGVPVVIFGHMHDRLQGGGQRSMVCRGADGRLYVNGARVPRWRTAPSGCGVERLFTMVDLEQSSGGWAAARVEQVWALPDGRVTEREPLWSVDDEVEQIRQSRRPHARANVA